jgi:hypothetical protein
MLPFVSLERFLSSSRAAVFESGEFFPRGGGLLFEPSLHQMDELSRNRSPFDNLSKVVLRVGFPILNGSGGDSEYKPYGLLCEIPVLSGSHESFV